MIECFLFQRSGSLHYLFIGKLIIDIMQFDKIMNSKRKEEAISIVLISRTKLELSIYKMIALIRCYIYFLNVLCLLS